MNIALITETFPPEVNGVAMTFGVIARELGLRGHKIQVFRPNRPDLPGNLTHPEYSEVPLPGMPIPGYPLLRIGLPAFRTLSRIWSRERPDLVHVATEGPLGYSAISAAKALGIPCTSSFHTNFHAYTRHYKIGPLKTLAIGWLRHVHNRTARTFAPTAELCRELTLVGFKNMTVLSRGVDTRAFSPGRRSEALRKEWGADRDAPVAIHVGRVAAEKNYPLLFRCYEAMKKANPRMKFVLAGEGPLKKKLMRQYPDCIFAGFFPRNEIGRYYASADVYIHASLTETFGNVLTEAMASGLAVAGFDYAAAKQFVRDNENGLSVGLGHPDRLVEASVRLATDEALRERLRVAGRSTVEALSWDSVIASFEADLLREAGKSGAPLTALPIAV